MNNGSESLVTVGEIDSRIFELNMKLRRIPARLSEARRQLDAEQKLLDEVLIPWTQLDNEIVEREATIRIALETIDKFEEHMKQVTTQKEYLAARKQVDEARRLNTRLQDEILERKIRQEELTPRLAERRGTHQRVLETYQSEESQILKEQETLQREVRNHTRALESSLSKVGDNALPYYQRLMKGGKQPAVVPVIAGTCHGCNMALPPQIFNLLLASNGKLFTCPTCNRIIYNQPVQETAAADAAAG